MPEYLSPGVYVEEFEIGARPIEGVSTSTVGFLGETEFGPTKVTPITSWLQFMRVYGSHFKKDGKTPYLPYAVEGFFANGGGRCYVARIVGDEAEQASLKLKKRNDNCLTVKAIGDGDWGNRIGVIIKESDAGEEAKAAAAKAAKKVMKEAETVAAAAAEATSKEVENAAAATKKAAENAPEAEKTAAETAAKAAETAVEEAVEAAEATEIDAETAAQEAAKLAQDAAEAAEAAAKKVREAADVARAAVEKAAGDEADEADAAAIEAEKLATEAEKAAQEAKTAAEAAEKAAQEENAADAALEVNKAAESTKKAAENAPEEEKAAAQDKADAAKAAAEEAENIATGKVAEEVAQAAQEAAKLAQEAAEAAEAAAEKTADPEAQATAKEAADAAKAAAATALKSAEEASAAVKKAEKAAEDAKKDNFFDLIVFYWKSREVDTTQEYEKTATIMEIFKDVSIVSSSDNHFDLTVNGASNLITISKEEGDSGEVPDITPIPGKDMKPTPTPLEGGNDGSEVGLDDYKGERPKFNKPGKRRGLNAFREIDDISILYAPDSCKVKSLPGLLITHCEELKYRFAIIDSKINMTAINDIKPKDSLTVSDYAAYYYPWIEVYDPLTKRGKLVPPGGHVAGIYARSDTERGVHKAPANEKVNGVSKLEFKITKGEQDILNPRGVNCIRAFSGRGILVWGARTLSSNSLWKYINVRRLFIYLEHSIDRGTQWVVFEPNDIPLWARVKQTITQFLTDVWRSGALAGAKPDEAFFVKCDRSTMSQGDIDNGRLICVIGVAPVKPAEFVIFRIAQWTGGQKK